MFLLRAPWKNKHFLIARFDFGSARKVGPSREPDTAARPRAEHFQILREVGKRQGYLAPDYS